MNLSFILPKVLRDYRLAEQAWQRFQATDDHSLPNHQLEKIREIWSDVVVDVPYYGKLVASGHAPAEITCWEDFYRIPVLTREVLQDRREEFVRRSGPPDLWRMTGGSTGNPVKFGVWNTEDEVIRVLKLVLWARVGYVPADRLFLIWGHSHLLGTGWRRHWNHFLRKAKDVVLGYKRVDAYSLSRERCEQYAGELLRYRPAGLIGYSAVLDYFVRSLPDWHGRFRDLGMKFVMPCAEPAPKEDSFELLGKVFGCPVIQEFGGVDFGHVGMKLGEGQFEVFGEENFVEVQSGEEGKESFEPPITRIDTDKDKEAGQRLAGQAGAVLSNPSTSELARDSENSLPIRPADGPAVERIAPDDRRLKIEAVVANLPATNYQLLATAPEALALDTGRLTLDSPAEQGAALVTSLYRRYLPLIRYRQGDVLGGVQSLPHGHVAKFEKLHGRLNDMVELADGTTIHSVAIFHCTHQEPSVLNIQMVLEDSGPRILLVTRDGLDEQLLGRIRHRLGQIAPSLADAQIDRADDLVTTRAGKRRWVVDNRRKAEGES